jgi:YidC/Oxa1 family membrane protein insertase
MDRKATIVLVICFLLIFVVWPQLVNRIYPPKPIPKQTNIVTAVTNPPGYLTNQPALTANTNVPPITPTAPTPIATNQPEQLVIFTNENARYIFTSHGGGIKAVELLKYKQSVDCLNKQRTSAPAALNVPGLLPILAIPSNELLQGDGVFKVTSTGNTVRAEKALPNGLVWVKEFRPVSNYLVNASIRIENRSAQPIALAPQEWNIGMAGPMEPTDSPMDLGLLWYDGSSKTAEGEAWFENYALGCSCFGANPRPQYVAGQNNVVWGEVHNQFFTIALMPQQPGSQIVAHKINLPPPSKEVIAANPNANQKPFAFQASIVYAATNLAPNQVVQHEFLLYAGPKENRTLERLAFRLKNDIDAVMGWGFFAWFAKALLWSMNGLHALGLSYALAIIAITVIIKLIFWPLTQASTRSMKRMAALQPQMNAIRERYKEDPTKMNRKMMEFMKEHKVNPLGGCLPMLLQIPVFIGFFTMVRSAIELRGEQFLWACDLSKPDTLFFIPVVNFPFNPLPLLMGLTMLWQARLTPVSPGMDPTQQKMMKYMPLIFLFILYNYSAGLTLYWTVQNLLTIAQTKLTRTKDDTGTAKAPAAGPPKKNK